jgi:site-specific DNA recombinase
MTRCAIYARFSSERQNERSIADQEKLCRDYARSQGWTVEACYHDAAISGQSMGNRPGIHEALGAAARGEFDILLGEDEDRIARDLEHLAHVRNRLVDVGAQLWTISSGHVDSMKVAFKGLIAEDYVRNLSAKTKRGMHSNAEKGLATGSRIYGYRSQPGGEIKIDEAEAEVVRRILKAYAEGDMPREIALALNSDGIPGPRGGVWNASTINGANKRGNGLLNTEWYIGVKVWGRNDVRKDRQTGKREHRYRPAVQWKRTPVPHLRIVDDATWSAVRARKDAARQAPQSYQRRPSLLGGLLRCGMCGGSYTTYTTGKIICLSKHEGRGCTNRRTPSRAKVEQRVLEALREQMLSPEATAAFVREYAQEAKERAASAASREAPLIRRLGEVERRIHRAVEAIIDGNNSAALRAKLESLEAEKSGLKEQLVAIAGEQQPVTLHPATADRYASMVAEIEGVLPDNKLNETEAGRRLRDAVRGLIGMVVITPLSQERGGEIDIRIDGTLSTLLAEQGENVRLGGVVAGGGIEPPTCGL